MATGHCHWWSGHVLHSVSHAHERTHTWLWVLWSTDACECALVLWCGYAPPCLCDVGLIQHVLSRCFPAILEMFTQSNKTVKGGHCLHTYKHLTWSAPPVGWCLRASPPCVGWTSTLPAVCLRLSTTQPHLQRTTHAMGLPHHIMSCIHVCHVSCLHVPPPPQITTFTVEMTAHQNVSHNRWHSLQQRQQLPGSVSSPHITIWQQQKQSHLYQSFVNYNGNISNNTDNESTTQHHTITIYRLYEP